MQDCIAEVAGFRKTRGRFTKKLFCRKISAQPVFCNLIGNTFREEGRYKEALSYYEKAKENDSSFVAAYCSIGDMYLKLNNCKEALLNYRKAIKVEKDFIIPYIDLANLYYNKNNFDEAMECCLKALKINPDSSKANYILGMSYKALGKKKKCIEYFKKAAFCGSNDAVDELRSIGIGVDLR